MQLPRRTVPAVVFICLGLVRAADAVTITWTGGAGTNNWHTSANWDLNRVPGAGDDVVIPDMTPNVNVTHSTGSTSINRLLSAEAFTLSGGTLTIDTESALNGAFALGGTLSGAGDVTVNGPMTWTGTGTMSGTGRTIIASGGSLAISDIFQKFLNRTLENHSANATWTPGPGTALNLNGGTLVNAADGTFTVNATSDYQINGNGGTNAFNNAGTFIKTGAGTLTLTTVFNAPVPFNNSGTTQLSGGGLRISSGGSNSGTIDAAAGTTLTLASTVNLDPASALTGTGTLTFTGGVPYTVACSLSTNRTININSTVNFDAPYLMTGAVNLGGTMSGSGDITVAGVLTWTGAGTMSGTGRTIIASGGSLAISDIFQKFLNRTLENHSANATWTPGPGTALNLNGGTLVNAADGTFTVNATSDYQINGNGGTNAFNNAGTFIKTGAGTLTLTTVLNAPVPFNNSGTTQLSGGGLRISSGGSNSGTIDAAAGTTVTLASTVNLDPASALTGTGTLTFTGGNPNTVGCTLSTNRIINILAGTVSFNAPYTFAGTLNLTGGALSGTGDLTITGLMNWTGTTVMSGSGKTAIASGATLNIADGFAKFLSRTLENHSTNATWTPTVGSSFNFNNGTLVNAADGVFTVNPAADINVFSQGGTNAIVNAGRFEKVGPRALTLTTFTTGIPFTNSGTVRVSAGILSLLALTNFSGTTLTGGTYEVLGSLRFTGANITTNEANVILDGAASSIQNTSAGNALTNFAINTTNGSFQIMNGRTFARTGNFNNAGLLTLGPGNSTFTIDTMTNSGTLTKPGAGTGNVNASASFNNTGTIDVPDGVLILSVLTNQSGTTLTGGTYQVGGTMRYGNANLGTNAATVILDGPASAIQDLAGANALGNVISNAPTGSLQIKNGRDLALPGTFVNQGQVRIGPGASTLSDTGDYVQLGGATTLNGGTLDPADVADIQGGELVGSGNISGSVRMGGTCRPTDLSITGDYQQLVQGSFDVTLVSTTPVSGYGRVSVGGTALLAGALKVTLANYVPSVADVFDFLSANQVEIKFLTIDTPVLANLLGWRFADEPGVLRLSVIDCGPGDSDGDGVGDACDTTPDLSWFRIAGGGGTSSGGQFKLSATIGQYDACAPDAPLSGGIFTLVGGFWAGVDSQAIPDCPLPGDMNADGLRNGRDIQKFADCLITGGPTCACADVNSSGSSNAADIAPFVQLLIN